MATPSILANLFISPFESDPSPNTNCVKNTAATQKARSQVSRGVGEDLFSET